MTVSRRGTRRPVSQRQLSNRSERGSSCGEGPRSRDDSPTTATQLSNAAGERIREKLQPVEANCQLSSGVRSAQHASLSCWAHSKHRAFPRTGTGAHTKRWDSLPDPRVSMSDNEVSAQPKLKDHKRSTCRPLFASISLSLSPGFFSISLCRSLYVICMLQRRQHVLLSVSVVCATSSLGQETSAGTTLSCSFWLAFCLICSSFSLSLSPALFTLQGPEPLLHVPPCLPIIMFLERRKRNPIFLFSKAPDSTHRRRCPPITDAAPCLCFVMPN